MPKHRTIQFILMTLLVILMLFLFAQNSKQENYPDTIEIKAADANSQVPYAVCHDNMKKCYERDFKFQDAGLEGANMNEFLAKEKAKGKSVRFWTTPRGFDYVKGFPEVNDYKSPNKNVPVMSAVCNQATKKCYDRTVPSSVLEQEFGATTIDDAFDAGTKKGIPVKKMPIPLGFSYNKSNNTPVPTVPCPGGTWSHWSNNCKDIVCTKDKLTATCQRKRYDRGFYTSSINPKDCLPPNDIVWWDTEFACNPPS